DRRLPFHPPRVPRRLCRRRVRRSGRAFDVTRSALADIFGEDRLATLPATAFPPRTADTEGARLLQTVGALPFGDDETVWSVVGEEIAMGQRFKGSSPGARSLYGRSLTHVAPYRADSTLRGPSVLRTGLLLDRLKSL
ncbi:hypothetical protein AB0M68_43940, partial [Streptomyces sp. NPDC051453]